MLQFGYLTLLLAFKACPQGSLSAGLEAVKKATAAAETVAPIILFNPRLARSVWDCVTGIAPMDICSFIQVCSEPAQKNCSTGLGKMHSPLFSSALQNRLTAGLCHCNSTCGDFIFIQVCSEPTEMQSSTSLVKLHSPLFRSALQNRLTAGLCHCSSTYGDLLSYRCAVSQLKSSATLVWAKCIPHCSVVLCKTGSHLEAYKHVKTSNTTG